MTGEEHRGPPRTPEMFWRQCLEAGIRCLEALPLPSLSWAWPGTGAIDILREAVLEGTCVLRATRAQGLAGQGDRGLQRVSPPASPTERGF